MKHPLFFETESDLRQSFRVPVSPEDFNHDPQRKRQSDELYVGTTVPLRRIAALTVFFSLVIVLYAGKAYSLQIVSANKYGSLAEQNRLRLIRQPAARGIMSDKSGLPLVANVPSFVVSILGADLFTASHNLELASSTLSRYGVSSDEWQKALQTAKKLPFESVAVIDRLSYEQAIALSVETAKLSGISVEVAMRRHYLPDGPPARSFSHILGYIGSISPEEYEKNRNSGYHLNDSVGKTGLEAFLENSLRGKFGFRSVEVDALGREKRVTAAEETENGTNVKLSLSAESQYRLETILADELRAIGKRRGAAVALDPRDGGIIALVSLPTYDPNLFTLPDREKTFESLLRDPDQPFFPRAIAGQYPSGSTIKPVIAAAALAEGVINRKTTIPSTGGIWYEQRWFFPDWKNGGHGQTNVVKAIAESVNTFFYTIGGGTKTFQGLGPKRIGEYARRFGLGRMLGIELMGEASGLIPDEKWKKSAKGEDWYIGDTYHLSIGQGDVLVTPLQIAAMTAAVANGGMLWRPRLIDSVYNSQTEKWTRNEPEALADNRELADELKIVKEGMRQAVLAGSARLLGTLKPPVAGKTGTAQWSNTRPPHAWFTGYAPVESPELVIAVLIEEGGEGSQSTARVAKRYLEWYFQ